MEAFKGTITRKMDCAFNSLQNEFRALCSRNDFEKKLDSLKESGSKSNRSSKLRKLFDMFEVCGIDYEKGKDNDYYEKLIKKAHIPDCAEIENRMLHALYTKYTEYPSPESYMQRIVDRLSNPDDGWSSDSLRLRILKQFIKYGNSLTYRNDSKVTIYGGEGYIKKYIEKKIGKKPKTSDEIAAAIDDGVFDALETADKSQKKPNGTYGILKLADDLAAGKFRTEGATQKGLYLFAMVYGMTFCSVNSIKDGSYYPESDIETNLFRDYYTNNLIRFITTAYKGKLSEYDLNPSGRGINYKNFAEMIYLYYISKDISGAEKIRLSDMMINRVKKAGFGKEKNESAKHGTAFYRDPFKNSQSLFSEDILGLSERDFEEFICNNYNCDTYAGSYETKNGTADLRMGDLQVETEQVTAFGQYKALVAELDDELECRDLTRNDCNYGLWFTDVSYKEQGFEKLSKKYPDVSKEKFGEFMELLSGINSFIRDTHIDNPEDMTRTALISTYYYYYNIIHEDDDMNSFEELFNNFKSGVDKLLEAAYYQPLSGRNLLDILVAFSSYAYINF